MFVINEDNSIYATRGDIVFFSVTAEDEGKQYKFQAGDVLRIKVYGKKDAESVFLQKDFPVLEITETVEIFLGEEDTKFGDVISKPTDYWYEVELNPGDDPQTIIGYNEDGPVLFKLFPEGADIDAYEPDPEDFPVVDEELDFSSPRPVANHVIAKAFANLTDGYDKVYEAVAEHQITPQMFGAIGDGVADDTESFQAAVNQLGVTASRLIVPYGVYRITDSIILNNKSNIQIIGAGRPVIEFKSQDNTKSGLHITNYKDIEISGFSFKSTRDKTEYAPAGNKNYGYASSNILAFYLENGENATFRDNHFTGMMSDYWIVGEKGEANKNILVDGWFSKDASMPTFCKFLDGAEFRHSYLRPATKLGAGNHLFYFSTLCKGVRVVDCDGEALDDTLSCLISFYNASNDNDHSIQPVDLLVKDFKGKGCRLFVGNKWAKVRFENVSFEQIYGAYLTNANEQGDVEYSLVDTLNGYYGEFEMVGCDIKAKSADLISDNEFSKKVLLDSCNIDLGNGGLILYNTKTVVRNCKIVCGTLVYAKSPEGDLDVYICNNVINATSFIISRRSGNAGIFTVANNVITGNNSRCLYSAGTSTGAGIYLLGNYMFNMNATYPIGEEVDLNYLVAMGNYANGYAVDLTAKGVEE